MSSVEVAFAPGQHVDAAAAKLCEVARAEGAAHGSFNEVQLSADKSSTPESVLKDYDRIVEERAKAYRESPEGIAATERSNEDRRTKQAIHQALMERLPALDWNSHVAVLDWLCEMQGPSDRIGVLIMKRTIEEAFAKRGYTPGMDCGPDYRKGDKNSEFRYLVGQALDGIVNGPAIHSILHKFTAEWKEKWGES